MNADHDSELIAAYRASSFDKPRAVVDQAILQAAAKRENLHRLKYAAAVALIAVLATSWLSFGGAHKNSLGSKTDTRNGLIEGRAYAYLSSNIFDLRSANLTTEMPGSVEGLMVITRPD